MKKNLAKYQRELRKTLLQRGFRYYMCLAPKQVVEQLKRFKKQLMVEYYKDHPRTIHSVKASLRLEKNQNHHENIINPRT